MRPPPQSKRVDRAARRDDRRGGVMVVFALLVFALMGIAAVAIDVGLASLTQAQMQTAVDTAALEGVQHRDFRDYRHESNSFRRPRVSELVRHVFDDDLHPTSGVAPTLEHVAIEPDGADAGRFGAGPLFTLTPTPGVTVPGASQLLGVPAVPVLDDPILQVNTGDLPSGDMLSGSFVPFAEHVEGADYSRPDFASAPHSIAARQALGFLVRMRRTNGANTQDSAAGVSSRGPTIPLLFGLGSAVRAAEGSSSDPRLEGITVRATAIAAGVPALGVGPVPLDAASQPIPNRVLPSNPNAHVRGLAPIAIEQAFWTSVLTYDESWDGIEEGVLLEDLDGDGVRDLTHSGAIVGRPIAAGSSTACTSVGRAVIPQSFNLPAWFGEDQYRETYFPIYVALETDEGASVERVIGYGYGTLKYVPGETSQHLFIRKGIQVVDEAPIPPWEPQACNVIVAPDNATAHLSLTALVDLDLSATEWERILAAHVSFAYPGGVATGDWHDLRPGTLLAPILVR